MNGGLPGIKAAGTPAVDPKEALNNPRRLAAGSTPAVAANATRVAKSPNPARSAQLSRQTSLMCL